MNLFLKTYLTHLRAISLARKIPIISEENAEFIKGFLREMKPKHLLEIGTANGYSALQFASILQEYGGDIITLEYSHTAHIEAVENIHACKLQHTIFPVYGDAKITIPKLQDGYFDFIYIDAMKREYLDYLLLTLPKMAKDACIVIDDVEKFREKMTNLFDWLEEKKVPYKLEKTDPDDSIMILYRSDFTHIL